MHVSVCIEYTYPLPSICTILLFMLSKKIRTPCLKTRFQVLPLILRLIGNWAVFLLLILLLFNVCTSGATQTARQTCTRGPQTVELNYKVIKLHVRDVQQSNNLNWACSPWTDTKNNHRGRRQQIVLPVKPSCWGLCCTDVELWCLCKIPPLEGRPTESSWWLDTSKEKRTWYIITSV